ncbi:MAG TPA: hypothetical protein VMZ00_01910 [Sporichthya sp.]|nr:hypothetical protein [Sporichthya sp.]
MKKWRAACAAAVLVVTVGGCAGHEEPTAIDGQVDFSPADDAKQVAKKTKGDSAAAETTGENGQILQGKDPDSNQPKVDKQECALAVAASNALVTKHVLALFPGKALRHVEPMRPADTFYCDPGEGPDFGGVSALWRNITGAEAIKILEKDGWKRTDPADGEPAWAQQNLKPGNGDLNLEPAEKYVVTFNAERGGRAMWVELTQDGMRAGIS